MPNMGVFIDGFSYCMHAQDLHTKSNGHLTTIMLTYWWLFTAYELWFKQILFEVDSIRLLFLKAELDERCMLEILKRVQRCALILKVNW